MRSATAADPRKYRLFGRWADWSGEFSPSLHLALRISRYFEVPVEVIFALDPFPRLGVAGNGARADDVSRPA